MAFRRRCRKFRDWVVGTFCLCVAMVTAAIYIQGGNLTTPILSKIHGMHFKRSESRAQTVSLKSDDIISVDDDFYVAENIENVNLTNYDQRLFMIGHKSTCGDNVDILVYIQSFWNNFLKRRNLRRTWASDLVLNDKRVKTVFIVGRPPDLKGQVRINNEQMLHGDVIEGDFEDTFQNISIKSLIAMTWIQEFCPRVKYVIKADDDIFMNLFAIITRVLPVLDRKPRSVACHLHLDGTSPIVRNKASKWYIPQHIFPNLTHLPTFCSGYAVIMTSDLVKILYQKSKHYELVHVDDVYMFGQLTQDINVNFIDIKPNLTLEENRGLKSYRAGNSAYIGVGIGGSAGIEELWSLTLTEETRKQESKQ